MDNREIDRLVSTAVMGWIEGVGPGKVLSYSPDSGFEKPDDIPHYSTDIAAAWEVAQKCYSRMDSEGYQLAAKFQYYISESGTLLQLAPQDAAKTICLAALKAVGVEVEPVSQDTSAE